MSAGPYQDTVFILDFLTALQPETVLDVGAGFGRWGFLCRCHLAWGKTAGQAAPGNLRVDAVEACPDNVTPLYHVVYDKVFVGDGRGVLPTLGRYDVIICSHMLEHLARPDAEAFLQDMKRHAAKAVILGLPFGDTLRAPVDGNAFEAHLSTWTAADFSGPDVLVRTFPFRKEVGAGVVLMALDSHAGWLVRILRSPLRRFVVRRLPGLCRAVRAAGGRWGSR